MQISTNYIILSDWCAVEETHTDGGRHWHAYILFTEKLRVQGQRALQYFDVVGVHPNVKTIKFGRAHQERLWKYMNKQNQTWGPWKGPNPVGTFGSGTVGVLLLSLYNYILTFNTQIITWCLTSPRPPSGSTSLVQRPWMTSRLGLLPLHP